ncbi:MAG TPA: DNRLRE domain-containing protein [Bacteroidia bacterium]|nr:DNRLRE domain-containing protein [Bacteroidia bacterium]
MKKIYFATFSIFISVNSFSQVSSAALRFDGVNDKITIPSSAAYNLGSSGYTIEAWIKDEASQNDPSEEPIISNEIHGMNNGFRLLVSNGRLTANSGNSTNNGLGPELRDGMCHHVAFVFDNTSTNKYYYVDGVLIYRSPVSSNVNSSLPLTIGSSDNYQGGTSYFKGLIKEVRIWNVLRSASEIQNNMNIILNGTVTPNLIGYWRCHEGSGQVITDYSTNLNNGVRGSLNTSESADPAWSKGCPSCALPSASISAGGPATFCFGGNVALNASPTGANYAYQWRVDGSEIAGATAATYTAGTPGSYDVYITNVSNNCISLTNTITVTVTGILSDYIIQPNGAAAKDALVSSTSAGINTNYGNYPSLDINAWTQYTGAAQRGFIQFDLSSLPVNSIVHHATLTLYNDPNSVINSGSHYHGYAGISNACWLQKVTAPWSENTITWNSQPQVTITNQVTLPQDTNPHQDYSVDVSHLVQDMVSSPSTNYGLRLRLTSETYFTAMLFASGDNADSTKWPRLSVSYYSTGVSVSASGGTTFCSGGSVVLNANAGIGLTYQWKKNGISIPGATQSAYSATATGNYTVQVDNSCSSVTSSPVPVTVNPLPSAVITPSGPTTFCSGGSVTLNAPVAANRSYQWKTGGVDISGATSSSLTVTGSGTFKVKVTNTLTGCTKTTTNGITVTKNSLPPSTITPQGPVTFCAGGSVVLAANTGTGLTYKWKKGSNFIPGATLSNYTATAGGNYRVQVTNNNSCSKTSALVTVSVPCKEGEIITREINLDFTVYPNPNRGEFTIRFSGKPISSMQIELTDEIGKVVKKFETDDETIVVNEENLVNGIYCLIARNNNDLVIKKISIMK